MKLVVLLMVLIVLLIAAYLGAGYTLYDQLSTVKRNPQNALNTPAHFQVNEAPFQKFDTAPYAMPDYQAVRFPSRQPGLMLAGWYVPGDPAAPAIVVTHGLSSCKCEGAIIVAAGMLHRHGFNVLLYDLRNHGESDSDGGRTAIGNKEYLDVLGAWDWLAAKGFPPERIGVYGASLGAGTTLIAFGEEPRIAAAFVDSPFSDLRQVIDETLTRQHYPTVLAYSGLWMARLVGGVGCGFGVGDLDNELFDLGAAWQSPGVRVHRQPVVCWITASRARWMRPLMAGTLVFSASATWS